MKNFNELAKLVKELDGKKIWPYMLEIAAVVDWYERLSAEQKQDAYDLATAEFENYDDKTIGANIFAEAAIETILDRRYADSETDLRGLFMEKISEELD